MRVDEREVFAEVLASVCEVYGKAYPSQAVFDLWFAALAEFDLAQVRQAFAAYVQGASENAHFMPKPADIVALVRGDTELAVAVAWAKVEEALSSVGQYQSVCFDDARIHAVIMLMGGWLKLFGSADELKWLKKEFCCLYEALSRQSVGEYPSHLVGLTERHNTSNGFAGFVRPPVPVGDIEAARLVYKHGTKHQALPPSQRQLEKVGNWAAIKALVAV